MPDSLPIPPLALRELVGVPDAARFDNPDGAPIFGELHFGPLEPREAYRHVFDLGCGCGRHARQLLQQDPRPERYVGVDLNPEMIAWCQANLTADGFSYAHHDVHNHTYGPDNSHHETQPIQQHGADFTLINAHSVFTHLFPAQSEHYLRECAAMLAPRGLMRTSWFFFHRAWFPALAPHRHAIFFDEGDPRMAVYHDWGWFVRLVRALGLAVVHVHWTPLAGHHNEVFLAHPDGFEDLLEAGLEPPGTVLGFGASAPPGYDGPPI